MLKSEIMDRRSAWNKKRGRYWIVFSLLFLLLILFFILNVGIGSVSFSPREVFSVFIGKNSNRTLENIIMQIRLPRTLAAVFLGGALGLSGYLLQTFFHNPIAGPYILGISSGAKLFVACVMVFVVGNQGRTNSFILILAAFLGALMATAFVLLLSRALERMSLLVVGGVMIGYICTAITDFIITFADDADIVNLHNWSKGSFSGISWQHIPMMISVIVLSTAACFLLSKPISALQLGEVYAKNSGVNVPVLRVLLLLLSSLLSASIVAFAGPVSFVGIAVPHIARYLLKTSKPILLIPASFLGGSIFCLVSDLIARMLFSPTELSISTVTAVFGAPIVIGVMLYRKKE